ncbi:MAG: amidase family protein [Actinomycetota bacterium]|nr:amidase family protein [Actinomycetota bacterium]
MTGLAGRAAGELAGLIATRQVSATEVLDDHLDRIAERNPQINAVVALDEGGARTVARRIDTDGPHGPLAGVPITVKEAFAVAGLATTVGMPERARQIARVDAPAVRLLRDAGAVIVGKTNVPAQLADLHCSNPLFGPTLNPLDVTRSCGGSSGGSAAALAAGMAALELGSDLSGSIRIPAAWCGVAGLRPSNGRISKLGHLPWPLDGLLEPVTSVVGPMARSTADLQLAFLALTGVEAGPARMVEGMRLAFWCEAPGAPIDTETAAVLSGARVALEGAGACIDDLRSPADSDDSLTLAWRLVDAEIAHGLSTAEWDHARAADSWPGVTVALRSHLADQEARLVATARWVETLAGFDALVCPAVAVAAQALDDHATFAARALDIDGVMYPGPTLAAWSLLTSGPHLPSVTVVAGTGTRSGLPIGAQLVGVPGADRDLLATARAVEDVFSAAGTRSG